MAQPTRNINLMAIVLKQLFSKYNHAQFFLLLLAVGISVWILNCKDYHISIKYKKSPLFYMNKSTFLIDVDIFDITAL